MKLKPLIIIVILTIVALPSIPAQFQSSELNTNDDTNKTNTGYDFTWVEFCRGQISDVYELRSGYTTYGYAFNAEDVICIINWDKPLFHHLNESEELAFCIWPHKGTISDSYINAYHGFLPPKFIWLIYRIISFVNTV